MRLKAVDASGRTDPVRHEQSEVAAVGPHVEHGHPGPDQLSQRLLRFRLVGVGLEKECFLKHAVGKIHLKSIFTEKAAMRFSPWQLKCFKSSVPEINGPSQNSNQLIPEHTVLIYLNSRY